MFDEAISALASSLTNPNTREAYTRAAVEFQKWCIDHGLHEPHQITRAVLVAYSEDIVGRLGASAVKQRVAALRGLLKHAGLEEVVRDPLVVPRPPARPSSARSTQTRKEYLLEHLGKQCSNTRLDLRDKTLICFLALVPIEVSSAVKLRTGDVIQETSGREEVIFNGPFCVRRNLLTEGRLFPLVAPLPELLKQYIDANELAVEEHGWLFRAMSRRSDRLASTALSRIDVWRILQKRSQEAGLYPCMTARELMHGAKAPA